MDVMAWTRSPDDHARGSVIAVDWSGAADDRGVNLWLAHCIDGELVELSGGWRRAEVIDRIVVLAEAHPGSIVGLDFSFGFPRWFAKQRGWSTAAETWVDVGVCGETWLRDCPRPFWGRPGCRRGDEEQFRVTEREIAEKWSVRPSSTFQIGGAGSVGTGSIRGMPHLLTLMDAGCAIWPFVAVSKPKTGSGPRQASVATPLATVVEMYPRLLTGPVVKRRREARERLLAGITGVTTSRTHSRLLEVAGSTEDAFDAAVSAIRMCAYVAVDDGLGVQIPANVEGRIWEPPFSSEPAEPPSPRDSGVPACRNGDV